MADAVVSAGQGPLLVLCGVSSQLTATLGRPGSVLDHRQAPATGRAAETLAPLVAAMLCRAGLTVPELGGVACVRGPGSFTGIRVVLATALGLSLGAGLAMAGLDYLPLLAATAARRATGVVVVLTHARAGLVYGQSFLADGGVVPLGPLEVLTVGQAADRVAEAAAVGPTWLVGEGAERYRQAFRAAAPEAVFFGPESGAPDPDVLLRAAAGAAYGFAPLEPLYLRPSDAEENLVAFAAVRGLSATVARERLRQYAATP